MTVAELNQRYGAPGRIVFRTGFAGYPNVVIANQFGSAEISLLGANILSYRPTGIGEVLFRPKKRDCDYNRGDGVHCGIPVCWPQFGNRFSKDLPQHGFARKMIFEVRGTEYTAEQTEITLGLKSNDETMKLWPHAFDLEYKVSVTMKLNLTLTTTNTGTEPFEFSCGYHPYFLVRNRNAVTVKGLKGEECIFALDEAAKGVRTEDFLASVAPDDVFALKSAPKHEFAVIDPGLRRATAIVSTGNERAVVWNCGEDDPMVDYGPDDWMKYICVEPVSDWPNGRTLAPAAKHVLAAAIQCILES